MVIRAGLRAAIERRRTSHTCSMGLRFSPDENPSQVAVQKESRLITEDNPPLSILYPRQKKSPGRLHTWKNDRKAGGKFSGLTRVAEDFGFNKSVVLRAWKTLQTIVIAIKKVGDAALGKQLQWMSDISSCRLKELDTSQQAPLLHNCVQKQGDKCRSLLWPKAFTKVACSPVVLNAAFL
ncbi:uncharacterized protein TNCV_3742121 [Trichonephila clavipes]|nr:uncharacterized protein TNCV_3742121 [Trichonephila clavipes]